ncbi:MAG TPA: MerR family transcriptional regulator [Myxococcales bacterium]|nr:MerR family transcriptional regulator [Myxococcales bacterium]
MAARNRKASATKRKSAARAKASTTRRKRTVASPAPSKAPPAKSSAKRSVQPPAPPSVLDSLPEGKLYYRIGEVAQITDVKPHVLRYWETEFRWMAPPKSRSKQRLYRRKDIEMILAIKRLLYEERYTIAGARQQLRDLGLGKGVQAAEGAGKTRTQVRRKSTQEEVSAGILASELQATYHRLRGELQEIRDLL